MTIAIHINQRDDKWNRLYNSFISLSHRYPAHHFIFIYNTPAGNINDLPQNCTLINEEPEIKNSLIKFYWYQYKLPSILNRYRVNIMCCSGEICNLKTAIPQIIIFNNVLASTGRLRHAYQKKYFEKCVSALTYNKYILSRIQKKFPQNKKKLQALPYNLDFQSNAKPVEEKEAAFACVINKKNVGALTTLLKAFSIFKKWQHSSFKLILIKEEKALSQFESIASYKYRNDITIIESTNPINPLWYIQNAFAYIHLYREDDEYYALAAMQAGVPTITSASETTNLSIFNNAALCAKESESGLAEQMMRLYKDEHIHSHYSKAGAIFAEPYTKEASTEALSRFISAAVGETL